MNIFKKILLFSLVLIIGILPISGCTDTTNDAYIYFELPKIPTTLDPQTASEDSELLIIKNIYEGLLRLDKNGKIVCGAAESYEKKGLEYTFKLRKDAKWSNGDDLTAEDFAFALKRAVNPKNMAPFAERLKCIKNAEKIISGKLTYNNLGVKVIDSKTLKITLDYNDKNFEKYLTTSVAMPCNKKIFDESEGKYGLVKDFIVSNGSYKLSKWNKTSFGIRLYRNDQYDGDFTSKNAAVFLTCRNDEDVTVKLKENKIDMAFVNTALSEDLISSGLKKVEYQNICWVLTISRDFSADMRTALVSLVGSEIYSSNLPSGYSPANSIFPAVITKTPPVNGIIPYNLENGKKIFKKEIQKLEENKFPSNTVLYYYDNGFSKNVVTDIVGHWQSNLSAFVNIEAASESELLVPELKEQTLSMAIFPVRADNSDLREYISKYDTNKNATNLSKIQEDILKNTTIVPLFFENTCIAYSQAITNLVTTPGDGYIDFSQIKKVNI